MVLDMPNYKQLAYHYGINQVSRVVKKGLVIMSPAPTTWGC
ncbi:MAG: hypothetical protein ABI743_04040 [bacterium]